MAEETDREADIERLRKVVAQLEEEVGAGAETEVAVMEVESPGGGPLKVYIGSDHAGYRLKRTLARYVEELGHTCVDVGCPDEASCDYPDYAVVVARAVARGEADRGVLVCGTGIGMAITANKIPGAYAAHCQDTYSARVSREHNDANILTLGGRVVGEELAKEITRVWLASDFSGEERHHRRTGKVRELENL
jgi:ribose 5-phosphate isomerase B